MSGSLTEHMHETSDTPYSAELALAVAVAREAGDLLRLHQRDILNVRHKGVVDLVTDADLASERLIAGRVLAAYPGDHLLAEEGTENATADTGDRRWIVDPLDGTTNYAHGYPLYAVSIGLEVNGTPVVGAVYIPMLDEMFAASVGGGATLNDMPIRVSSNEALIDSMLSTGFAYDPDSRAANYAHWNEFATRAQAVRRDGAAALDLVYVACGRYDGFWEAELSPWDMAAGSLIVTEAGGRLTGYSGEPFDLYARQVVATNGLIHDDMLAVLARDR